MVEDRHGQPQEHGRRHLARHERDGEALEDRVRQHHGAAGQDRRRGEQHRPEAHHARLLDGERERHALAELQLDEVDQDDAVADDDPRAHDEADHAGRGEESAGEPVRRQDADERERGTRITSGTAKLWKSPPPGRR